MITRPAANGYTINYRPTWAIGCNLQAAHSFGDRAAPTRSNKLEDGLFDYGTGYFLNSTM